MVTPNPPTDATSPAAAPRPPARWPGVAARAEGRTLRTGHKGADAVVTGNTLASLAKAVELGADVVEFDALPDADGVLRLAHDADDLRARPDAPTLGEALAWMQRPELAHAGLGLDSKSVGDEQQIVDLLREHGVVDRTLVSTMETLTLRALRRLEPALRLGRSVPRITRDYYSNPITRPALIATVLAARRVLPPLLIRELRSGRIDAVMAHWGLVTPRFARQITAYGELHAWTVDDPSRARTLAAMGVTGITTNDPRLLRW
ncbi:MAG: glycerophosphodiester phosphodiesterase [Patulibacter sp.]|nr:glycerophosphodiester phosphodiesterase [Patulibacter sp.]